MLCALLVCSFLIGASMADCGFPNGTDATLNWWQIKGSEKITISEIRSIDTQGNTDYPIHLVNGILLRVSLNNQESESWNGSGFTVNIKVSQYGSLGGCEWTDVPNFSSLVDLPACDNGVPCPFPLGQTQLSILTDLSDFETVLALLKSDSPYQFLYTLSDEKSGHGLSFAIQARAYTK